MEGVSVFVYFAEKQDNQRAIIMQRAQWERVKTKESTL